MLLIYYQLCYQFITYREAYESLLESQLQSIMIEKYKMSKKKKVYIKKTFYLIIMVDHERFP